MKKILFIAALLVVSSASAKPHYKPTWYKYNKIKKWNRAFSSSKCGGYYSDNPCRAQSCNLDHEYCVVHKKIIKNGKGKK